MRKDFAGNRWRKMWTGVIPVAALVACSAPDATVAPKFSARDVGGPSLSLASSMTRDGSQMTVIDDNDGMVYTFDVASGEIRLSDGHVLVLDPIQAEQAAAAFLRTIESDWEVADLESIPAGSCPDNDPTCVSPYSTPESNSDASQVMVNFSGTYASVGPTRPLASFRTPANRQRNGGIKPSGGDEVGTMSYNDPCTDVANVAMAKVYSYRAKRSSWIKDVVVVAIAEFGSHITRHVLPPGSVAAATFGVRYAEHEAAGIQMGMLAWTWNSYNCDNRTVIAGRFWRPSGSGGGGGGGGGGGTGSATCSMEHVQISFNDGWTWHWIYVEVCVYASE